MVLYMYYRGPIEILRSKSEASVFHYELWNWVRPATKCADDVVGLYQIALSENKLEKQES